MALTLAHPAAVSMFRGLVRRRALDLPALLVGSIAPDIGNWIGRPSLADRAHTWMGSLTTAVPIALALLAVYHLLRRPVFFALPNPHRHCLADCPELNRGPWRTGDALATVAGIFVGIICHLLWDAGTEQTGWLVSRLSILQGSFYFPSWSPIQGALPVYFVSNLITSVVALAGGLLVYRSWYRARLAGLPHPYLTRDFDKWRWFFWTIALLIAGAHGLPTALPLLGSEPDFYRVTLFFRHWGISFAATFVTLAAVGTTLVYFAWWRRWESVG